MTAKYLFLFGVVLYSLGCSNQVIEATKVSDTTVASPTVQIVPQNEPTPELPVEVVGKFTNVKGNGEHEWGYSVHLWRQGANIYGLLSGTSGTRLVGDPPTGILVDQVFDEKTGKLSFKTTTPSGTYAFNGVLTSKTLKGQLLYQLSNETEKITLKRDKEWSRELMDSYASYAEWKEFADRILRFRGPKP